VNRSYFDITSRLGEPLWWDDQGVPRYAPFRPQMCGVYDRYVAYMEIACQACGKRFFVASSVSALGIPYDRERVWEYANGKARLCRDLMPSKRDANHFHYGDPPNHSETDDQSCLAGNSMNCIDLRIIEFWEMTCFEWVRRPEYEIEFDPLEDVADTPDEP
jgi:hypothetical protein